MEPVYVLLAWACLVVFLQLDDSVDMERVRTFPLVLYAAEHLVNRANFENVEPKIENASKDLFNSMKPHHLTWTWIYNVEDRFFRPLAFSTNNRQHLVQQPSYYAVSCGFTWLAKRLIVTRAEDVNDKSYQDSAIRTM